MAGMPENKSPNLGQESNMRNNFSAMCGHFKRVASDEFI